MVELTTINFIAKFITNNTCHKLCFKYLDYGIKEPIEIDMPLNQIKIKL